MKSASPQPPAPPAKLQLARLWQPRRGLFWLVVVFNLLSTVMAAVLRGGGLSGLGLVFVGVLALGNALAGMWLAWRLLRGE